jgi:UDP-glucuronate decarboxylase
LLKIPDAVLCNIISEDLADIAREVDVGRLRGKTVLVAGAAGFLPAYMVETLLFLNDERACDCRVIALVRNPEKAGLRFARYMNRPDFVLVIGDVSSPPETLPRAEIIIHAASPASPKYFGRDPVGVMAANILGMRVLLERARVWKVESFLYFSSGEVYGQVPVSEPPVKESRYGYVDILNVRSCYAESKRAAETLAVCYWMQYKVPCKMVRPFHTYGPGMALDDGRVYADFVADVVARRNITLKSDGRAVRAFCYLADAVRGFFTVLLHGLPGQAYNVGNPDGALSILELSELLVDLVPGLQVESNAGGKEAGYLQSPIVSNVPDVSLLTALGWSPRYAPRDGFARTIEHFRETS